MPTYKNKTDKPIIIDLDFTTRVVKPGETIETFKFLDYIEGLERISDMPLFNPFYYLTSFNLVAGDEKEIDIYDKTNGNNSKLTIYSSGGQIKVYVNSKDYGYFLVNDGELLEINNYNIIGKIIIEAVSDSTITVSITKL